jgi:hypothetical protein
MDIAKGIYKEVVGASNSKTVYYNSRTYIVYIHGRFHTPTEYVYDAEATYIENSYKGSKVKHYGSEDSAAQAACAKCEQEMKSKKMI